MTERIRARAKIEVFTLWRFSLIGALASTVHIGLVWVLIENAGMNPFTANLVAYLTAFGFSFAGQYTWTFRSQRTWSKALVRFFLVSLVAFGLNNLVLALSLETSLVSDSVAAVLAAMTIPLFTYLLSRFWAFR